MANLKLTKKANVFKLIKTKNMSEEKPKRYQISFEHRDGKLYVQFHTPDNQFVAEREVENKDSLITEEMLQIIQGDPRFLFNTRFRDN